MSFVQTALGLVYPPQCISCSVQVERATGLCNACWTKTPFVGGLVCDQCGLPQPGSLSDGPVHCDTCLSDPPDWDRGRSALLYKDGARSLVLALKHADRQEIAPHAGRWMAHAASDLLSRNSLVIPVPLHWKRLAKRRYNQSALLAQALARESGHRWAPDVLERVRETPSLDGKDRTERQEILEGAISVNRKRRHQLAGRPVLIVDDVLTSGATLNSSAKALRDAGATEICVVTLARVVKDT